MNVWAGNFLVIWIAVRRTAVIQTNQHNYLSGAILICPLCQINPAAADVNIELLTPIRRSEGYVGPFAWARIVPLSIINPLLLHSNQSVSFILCKNYFSHYTPNLVHPFYYLDPVLTATRTP